MLDMKYFAIRRFAAGAVGITIAFLVMFSMFFVLTQYLQYVRGYSPLRAGFAGLPAAFTLIAISPRSTKLSGRIGIKPTVVMGMSTIAVGMFLMSLVGGTTPYVFVAGALIVMASGMAVTTPALSAGIVTSLPMHKAGVSSAVNDTTREVGGAMGIAVVGSIVTAVYRHHVKSALAGLPPAAADQASKNVGRATRVAQELSAQGHPEEGARFLHAVRQAFIDGAHVGLRVTAVLALCGAAFIAWRLPSA
jgi:Na+/melibiose symporter-like transporter